MTTAHVAGFLALPLAIAAVGASAQEAISYETGEYAYAQEAPQDAAATEAVAPTPPIVFRQNAVIQPIPSIDPDSEIDAPAPVWHADQGDGTVVMHAIPAHATPVLVEQQAAPRILYAYPAVYGAPPAPGSASRVIYRAGDPRPHGNVTYVYEGATPVVPMGGRVVEFDSEAWLAECRRRIAPVSYYEEDGNGEVVGAVVGAAAGGLIGNRVAGRGNRTLGTLAGAGIGAVVGAAVGDAVDDRAVMAEGQDTTGQCEAYLDGYMESARTGGLHGQHSATGEYMLVPVTVLVPQRAVYGE